MAIDADEPVEDSQLLLELVPGEEDDSESSGSSMDTSSD
jgi:hypothetical protein